MPKHHAKTLFLHLKLYLPLPHTPCLTSFCTWAIFIFCLDPFFVAGWRVEKAASLFFALLPPFFLHLVPRNFLVQHCILTFSIFHSSLISHSEHTPDFLNAYLFYPTFS